MQANLESLQSETQPLIEKKEKFETELIDLQKNVDECKAALTLSESELKICQSNETMEKRKYESLKVGYEEAENALTEKQAKLQELNKIIPEIKKEIFTKQNELQQNKIEEQRLTQQIRAQRADVSFEKKQLQYFLLQVIRNHYILFRLMKNYVL